MSKLDLNQPNAAATAKTPEEKIKILEETIDLQNRTINAYEAAFAEAEQKAAKYEELTFQIKTLKVNLKATKKISKKRLKNIFKFMKMVGVDQTFLVNISKIAFSTKKGKAYFPKKVKLETWKN